MQGWVSIHRSLQSHWLWVDKPFSKGQAWIDILLLANHQDNKFLLGNELVEVKQGSFITSEVKLMDRWGWSKTKVRNFLKILEEDNMIIKKSDTKKTTLTVVNYSAYQEKQTTQRPLEDHLKTTQRPLEDTNNNVNNVNNENNENKKDIDVYFEELWKLYPNKKGKSSTTKKAKKSIYKIGYENMVQAIDNYKQDLEVNIWKQPLNGSTFFNGRYEDYLKENYVVEEGNNGNTRTNDNKDTEDPWGIEKFITRG